MDQHGVRGETVMTERGIFGFSRPLGITPLKKGLKLLGYEKVQRVPESLKPKKVNQREIREVSRGLKPKKVKRGEL